MVEDAIAVAPCRQPPPRPAAECIPEDHRRICHLCLRSAVCFQSSSHHSCRFLCIPPASFVSYHSTLSVKHSIPIKMRTSVFTLLAAASAVSAQTGPAPQVAGNPAGASYVATLPVKEGSPLRGAITAVSAPDGVGVLFSVSFSGLPATGGPFMYHLHEKPVPENGNCTATGAHLDPYKRGEVPICDASKPETCQTGDLSGKHGNFTSGDFSAEYVDPYSALIPGNNAYFGNLSFVLHLANKTRIGCANFVSQGAKPSSGASLPAPSATGSYNTTVMPTGGSPVTPTSAPPSEFTGAAVKAASAAGAVLVAAAAFVL
ncbi:hypothetical protein HBH92_040550 [Parastagonospora nodorum]|nr:hypothetical protein HBH50_019030 [Parastagonospora nodorum]KAH4098082.1 hypothetical protein HBH48_028290 [Parastagonospora nodorum]KAH4419051.1 hypothetical protein HBH92_040550 [Parastagonospora nodorum]KAH4445699.1 hypothetical protein HBH93_059810 [Parastagonospora nodorum]KAH4458594.1 hypothetical protein HBH91_077220 [Parastagonospora nodorum]